MSHARGLLTPLMVTAIGIGTGVAIFNPAFKQDKEQKKAEQNVEINDQHATPSPSPEEQIRTTEEAVADAEGATGIPKDAERWAKVQSGQFSKPVDTFSWSGVPLDQYSTPEKPS